MNRLKELQFPSSKCFYHRLASRTGLFRTTVPNPERVSLEPPNIACTPSSADRSQTSAPLRLAYPNSRTIRGPHAFDYGWADPELEDVGVPKSTDLIAQPEWELIAARPARPFQGELAARVARTRHERLARRPETEPELDSKEKSTQEFLDELIEAQKDTLQNRKRAREEKRTANTQMCQTEEINAIHPQAEGREKRMVTASEHGQVSRLSLDVAEPDIVPKVEPNDVITYHIKPRKSGNSVIHINQNKPTAEYDGVGTRLPVRAFTGRARFLAAVKNLRGLRRHC